MLFIISGRGSVSVFRVETVVRMGVVADNAKFPMFVVVTILAFNMPILVSFLVPKLPIATGKQKPLEEKNTAISDVKIRD